MKRAITTVVAIVCSAAALIAADASGNWVGTLTDERSSNPTLLILKQDGTRLTGTVGADESDRHEIQNGTIQGDAASFEVHLTDRILFVRIKMSEKEMTGSVEMKRNGQTIRTATLALKRQ
jgi:hypothetical protein